MLPGPKGAALRLALLWWCCLAVYEIGGIFGFGCALIALEHDLLCVVPQVIVEIVVGQPLAVVAVELVHSLVAPDGGVSGMQAGDEG